MAWVPPRPGMGMGRAARWDTRSTGMTTFSPPTPDEAPPAPVPEVPTGADVEVPDVVTGVVAGVAGAVDVVAPSAVTT